MPKTSWTQNADTAFSAVFVLWGAYLLNYLVLPVDFTAYGIHPRDMSRIWGILLCPFLHANLQHIVANTVAMFVLLTLALSFSRRLTCMTILLSVFLAGGVVWLLGDPGSNYIGASGVVFGLTGFLLSTGVFRRELRALLYGLVAFAAYGGSVLMLVNSPPGTSWLAHASGFACGVLVAWRTRNREE